MHLRLKSDKVIDRLFSEGKSVFIYPIKMVYFTLPDEALSKNYYTGVSVSKRNFKRAVDRNRIKRQLREAVRQNINEDLLLCSQGWTAMFIYVSKDKLEFSIIAKTVAKLFKKGKLC